MLKNLVFVIKHNGKINVHLSIRIWRNLKKCTSFEEQISFNLFCSEIIMDMMYMHCPKNLSSRSKFQKTETLFCRWKNYDCNNIPVNGKPFYLFSMPENAFLKATVNCHKIIQKQFIPFKTTVNWLLNDICELVIGCFD